MIQHLGIIMVASSEFSLQQLCLQILLLISQSEESKVIPFGTASGNVELMHECLPKHMRIWEQQK